MQSKCLLFSKMKFSIVTPVYNGEKYLAETIESVLSQKGDFELEYIIQDGSSTDGTVDIIKSYEQRLGTGKYPIQCKKVTLKWFSEKDNGMYDAIEKGFARGTGEIMAYINADDKYLPGAFASVAKIFSTYPEIEWAKGVNSTSDEAGDNTTPTPCFIYQQDWLRKGIYGRSAYFVQQDSVFWKRSLWEKACPKISNLRLAGDYALWITFAKYAPLWSFNKQVSVFRERAGQLSEIMRPYIKEQNIVAPHNLLLEKRIIFFFILRRFLKLNPRGPLSRMLFLILFPFYKKQWYIDFDLQGNPIKKTAQSYLV